MNNIYELKGPHDRIHLDPKFITLGLTYGLGDAYNALSAGLEIFKEPINVIAKKGMLDLLKIFGDKINDVHYYGYTGQHRDCASFLAQPKYDAGKWSPHSHGWRAFLANEDNKIPKKIETLRGKILQIHAGSPRWYGDLVKRFTGGKQYVPALLRRSCTPVPNEFTNKKIAVIASERSDGWTPGPIKEEFYGLLINTLLEKNCEVYTNLSTNTNTSSIHGTGSKFYEHERVFSKTKPLQLPIDEVIEFMQDRDAVFIGERSGFCDILGPTHIKKIILYQRGEWWNTWKLRQYSTNPKESILIELDWRHPAEDMVRDINEVI